MAAPSWLPPLLAGIGAVQALALAGLCLSAPPSAIMRALGVLLVVMAVAFTMRAAGVGPVVPWAMMDLALAGVLWQFRPWRRG